MVVGADARAEYAARLVLEVCGKSVGRLASHHQRVIESEAQVKLHVRRNRLEGEGDMQDIFSENEDGAEKNRGQRGGDSYAAVDTLQQSKVEDKED